ncbi:MAG: hypothetical protein QW390_03900 [Candidatus Bathyarchaeia archaeon]
MPDPNVLRFRLRKGDREIELEGEFAYVKEKFESLLGEFPPSTRELDEAAPLHEGQGLRSVEGILERTPEGRLYLAVPFNLLTSKEAVALFLYAHHPRRISNEELSDLLTQGWKTIRAEAVRARASELRREGKLLAEDGAYTLSGAGIQWVEGEIIGKIRKMKQESASRSLCQPT